MKKLLKSKKALSPVIAAIILIAVTVAVSIAVAAWMGSLSMGFMETKELTINNMEFTANSTITLSVTNTGTSALTIGQVKVNSEPADFSGGVSIAAGDPDTVVVDCAWNYGDKYSVSLFATDGTLVASYTDTAPTA